MGFFRGLCEIQQLEILRQVASRAGLHDSANWRPWHFKTVDIPEGGLHGRSCQCVWAVARRDW